VSWVKLDDRYFSNGKIRQCSPSARLLHVASMCHCAAALNDGEFPVSDLPLIQAMAGVLDVEAVNQLAEAGLWDVLRGDPCNAVTGYRVHDFLEYNPPAARVLAARKATAERVAKWRGLQCNAVTGPVTNGVSNGTCNTAPPSPVPRPLPGPVPRRKRSPAAPVVSVAFAKFWEAYPRKVAKGAALKAWPGDDMLPAILAALEWQAPEFRSRPADKVPHAGTWLNGKRWEDEKPSQRESAQPIPLRWATPHVD
jgi:hypothetical protein